MRQPLVSVIVPIYMIDRYVGRCIESILRQTYRNLEIILVDDGGTDRCAELCDLYARKDPRIRVIHKSNGGLVSARKAGLRQAGGVYVSYVDGDDWIGPGFIETLVCAAQDCAADMVCAGFSRDLFSRSASFAEGCPCGIYRGEGLRELWRGMLSSGPFYRPGVSTYVWNKLFRRSVLLAPQFAVDDRISVGEDAAVAYPSLLNCRTVVVTGNTDYHYRQREDSMLKRRDGYASEARRLRYLYDGLVRWARQTDPSLRLAEQAADYMLSIAVIRSGGKLPQEDFSVFGTSYYGKNAVVYSAGTFGQQLVGRLKESRLCRVAGWLDDDCWEYRRCCLDVDPVESAASMACDAVLLASVDPAFCEQAKNRLVKLGVNAAKILPPVLPEDRSRLLECFLDADAIEKEETKYKKGVSSHA